MKEELNRVFKDKLAVVEEHLRRPLSPYERFLLEMLPNCDVRDFCNHVLVRSILLRIAEMLGVELESLSESVKGRALKALRAGDSFKSIYIAALKEHRKEEDKTPGLGN